METKTCRGCNREIAIDQFAWKSKSRGIRQAQCKQCYSAYNRAYYASGEKEKQKKRVVEHARSLRDRFREWKSTQRCVVCGEQAPECLDLHHLDPSLKDDEISRVISSTGSWKRIEDEIAKCIVVCANCHRKIHSGRIHWPTDLEPGQ